MKTPRYQSGNTLGAAALTWVFALHMLKWCVFVVATALLEKTGNCFVWCFSFSFCFFFFWSSPPPLHTLWAQPGLKSKHHIKTGFQAGWENTPRAVVVIKYSRYSIIHPLLTKFDWFVQFLKMAGGDKVWTTSFCVRRRMERFGPSSPENRLMSRSNVNSGGRAVCLMLEQRVQPHAGGIRPF